MSVCSTAKRRRKQAAMGYKHMAPLDRPKYKKRDALTSAQRLRRQIEREKAYQLRKGQSKK